MNGDVGGTTLLYIKVRGDCYASACQGTGSRALFNGSLSLLQQLIDRYVSWLHLHAIIGHYGT